MRKTRVWITAGCCVLALAVFAWAQGKPKAGLWEITTNMNMGGAGMPQMPQLPAGVKLPPGVTMPQAGGSGFGSARTMQVCVTQAMIDRYGGPSPAPQNRNADCKVTNIQMKPDGMTADIACTGQMTASGTVESTFADGGNTTNTNMHLKGTMQMGQNSQPIDMTMQSKSVYKGPDCGSVKPVEMPAGAQTH